MSAPTYTRQVNPWTNNVSAITATIMTNIENFLVNVSSWLQNTISDANITSDGLGNLSTSGSVTVQKVNLTTGSIKRFVRLTGSGTQTITHSWGEQADLVVPYYNGGFGTAPTQAIAVKGETANSFIVVGQNGYSWTVLAAKF